MAIDSMTEHSNNVARIAQEVERCYREGLQIRIYHGGTNSTRPQNKSSAGLIDTRRLNRIISVDVEGRFALVEPNVSMDALVDESIKYGLIPPIVMEFPKITVGGGIQGGAGESSSFKWGLFHDICSEYEMVLGDGLIVKASVVENPDLYHGTACSYGTLGIVTLIKVELIPAKEFIRVRFQKAKTMVETVEMLTKATLSEVDFVDGIVCAPDFGIVMTGIFSDTVELPRSTFSRAKDEWFFLHAQQILEDNDTYEEIIPIKEYLFRYNQAAFWAGKYVFRRLRIPSLRIVRQLLNPLLSAKSLYRVLHATGISQQYIIQDISVPNSTSVDFLSYIDANLHIYPLWLCPLRTDTEAPLAPNFSSAELVMNVGIWGEADRIYEKFIAANRALERFIAGIGGRKVFYAHSYYPREEFWQIYDRGWYESLRRKYKAERTFPDIFDKVFVSDRCHPVVLVGLMKLIMGKLTKKMGYTNVRSPI